MVATTMEITLRFVFANTAPEYHQAFRAIADGSVDVTQWVTAIRRSTRQRPRAPTSSVSDVHCKVVIRPTR